LAVTSGDDSINKQDKLCLIAIGVVILLVVGLFVVMHFRENYDWPPWEDKEKTVKVVERGDEVQVHYTGKFLDGRIFDTSLENIGRNDTFPKSSTFNPDKNYDQLTFVVGDGSMIQGFDEGVRGMKKGEERSITVPPEKGYGETDPDLIYNIPVVNKVPIYEDLPRADFDSNYSKEVAKAGVTSAHHFWGWPIRIVTISNETVTIENNPGYGENYRGFSWNTTITGLSTAEGKITVRHLVGTKVDTDTIAPERFRKYDSSLSPTVTETGVISVENNEIIIDFNKEVVGKTLIFEVSIEELTKGED
jgi:FKBP-type peptidyl-prolyl cis-trans isomerase 2